MDRAMVSLTFDDALDEHLDHAIPLLDSYGLVGTFYTHLAAPALAKRLDEWSDAARRGHELGNHTIFHPADGRKAWVREGNAIDHYTFDRMRMELETANRLLSGLDGEAERTFAYPCSNSVLGDRGLVKSLLFKCGFEFTRLPGLVDRFRLNIGSTQKSYIPLMHELFMAARGGGLVQQSSIPSLAAFDRWYLLSVAVDGWTYQELVDYTKRGLANNGWVILQFHGIGGGHQLNCDLDVFRQFVVWLAEQHSQEVVTVVKGSREVWQRPVASPIETSDNTLATGVEPLSRP